MDDCPVLTTLLAVVIVTTVTAAACYSDVDVSTTTPTSTLGSLPSASTVQRVVSGTVADLDGTPLAGVDVSTSSGTPATITDSTGSFSITINSQTFLLRFAHDGYRTRDSGPKRGDDPFTLSIYMEPRWYFPGRHR